LSAARTEVREVWANGHPVYLGPGSLAALQQRLDGIDGDVLHLVLGDGNTLRHCLPELLRHVPALREAELIEVPPGEASKDIRVSSDIWRHLLERGADRQALLVCLGGGVVTDLGGFVAGTYKRGIRFVNVPTSLMGMVDAAIGGKTGVDLAGVKNMVGLFHDPLAVHVHVPFLRTLGKRELLNGLAEMIKHGLVADADHWEAILQAPLHDLDALTPLIERSAEIKCAVVKEDPLDLGHRKVLNFGHTIGHAIEAHSWEGAGRGLLHGEAVAAGMICAAWLSWRRDGLPREELDRITDHLLGLYKPHPFAAADAHRLIELMRHDKKNAEGSFRFTLLHRIGEAVVDQRITPAQVKEALEHYHDLVRHRAQGEEVP